MADSITDLILKNAFYGSGGTDNPQPKMADKLGGIFQSAAQPIADRQAKLDQARKETMQEVLKQYPGVYTPEEINDAISKHHYFLPTERSVPGQSSVAPGSGPLASSMPNGETPLLDASTAGVTAQPTTQPITLPPYSIYDMGTQETKTFAPGTSAQNLKVEGESPNEKEVALPDILAKEYGVPSGTKVPFGLLGSLNDASARKNINISTLPDGRTVITYGKGQAKIEPAGAKEKDKTIEQIYSDDPSQMPTKYQGFEKVTPAVAENIIQRSGVAGARMENAEKMKLQGLGVTARILNNFNVGLGENKPQGKTSSGVGYTIEKTQ